MLLAFVQPADDQDARQPEGAAGISTRARRPDPDAPWRDDAPRELLAGLSIDYRDPGVEDATLAKDYPCAHLRPLGDHATTANERVIADHHGCSLGRLQPAADPDSSGEVDAGPDLGTAPYRRPGVDHRPGPDVRADVDVAGHHHCAPADEAAPPGRGPGYHPYPGLLEAVLEREAVGVLEGPELGDLDRRNLEEQQDRPLQPLVDSDFRTFR